MWQFLALPASLRHIFSYFGPTTHSHFETTRTDNSDVIADMVATLADTSAPDSVRLWKLGRSRPHAFALELQRGVNTSPYAETIEHAHDHFAYMLDYVVPAPGAGGGGIVETNAQRRAALMNALHDLTLLETPPVTPAAHCGTLHSSFAASLAHACSTARVRIPPEVRAHSPQLADRLDRAYALRRSLMTGTVADTSLDAGVFRPVDFSSVTSDRLESLPSGDIVGAEFFDANEDAA
jgi:hypothetical protein